MTDALPCPRVASTADGTSIAISHRDMRLSELIIIYLAAAAPFGVATFLRQPVSATRTRALSNATGAALLWPLALLKRMLVQKNFIRVKRNAVERDASTLRARQVDDAQRTLLIVLYRTEELAGEAFGAQSGTMQQAVRDTVACVECYVGLTRALTETGADVYPSRRVTELCRIAGRKGDDLLVAGRCLQRRHLARLRTHQAESRLQLLHALAEMREVFERTHAAQATEPLTVRPLCIALLESFARTIDLLSLLEDEQAALSVARLLDAACTRLRLDESSCPSTVPETRAPQDTITTLAGDELCPTSIPHPHLSPPRATTNPARG